MERIAELSTEEQHQDEAHDGWAAWDAVPRDGPAVFVVDLRALDETGRVQGRWLNPYAAPEDTVKQLSHLLGRNPDQGGWAIVDQVGLGPRMLPELVAASDLAAAAREAQHGG